mmetsp:Transcript_62215/g.116430  ORF Transcript_62215/g.116430 Transcript_62215/m.116430 type:complete len:89 (+) Transcript_62215:894-1160(+)
MLTATGMPSCLAMTAYSTSARGSLPPAPAADYPTSRVCRADTAQHPVDCILGRQGLQEGAGLLVLLVGWWCLNVASLYLQVEASGRTV